MGPVQLRSISERDSRESMPESFIAMSEKRPSVTKDDRNGGRLGNDCLAASGSLAAMVNCRRCELQGRNLCRGVWRFGSLGKIIFIVVRMYCAEKPIYQGFFANFGPITLFHFVPKPGGISARLAN